MMKKLYSFILFNILILTYLQAKITLYGGGDLLLGNHSNTPSSSVVDNLPLKILAYPNPTKDRLFIESENSLNSISVYNLLGQKLKHFSLDGAKKYEITVSDLPSGTYILTVQSGNQTINQKFTKID